MHDMLNNWGSRGVKLEAFWYGVRVFIRQVRCHHEMVLGYELTDDGHWVRVRYCDRDCGYVDLHPVIW